MTKSLLSFVWVAGPLSGLIMQPVVGVWSDNCTSRFGRRRPFMIIGSIIVGFSLMLMAWTREVVDVFVSEAYAPNVTIVVAVFSVFAADFSVNAVQATCRAIIVDTLPKSKQELANAWAGRMVAFGHLVGFYAGFLDLIKYIKFLGDTQLKILCAISSVALWICVGITVWAVEERVLTITGETHNSNALYHILQSLVETGLHLPKRIKQIFTVQLFAWYGWFTFLFYASTWVGEVYVRYDAGDLSDSHDLVGDIGRVGSFALTMYSIVTVICSLILPPFIVSPNSDAHTQKSAYEALPEPLADFMIAIAPYRPTLPTAWMIGNIVYAITMFASIFVRSVRGATFIIAICGFSWALSSWAPFSLVAEEIRKLNTVNSGKPTSIANSDGYETLDSEMNDENDRTLQDIGAEEAMTGSSSHFRLREPEHPLEPELTPTVTAESDESDMINILERSVTANSSTVLQDTLVEDGREEEEDSEEESSDQAGSYMGLHNVSITIPQFISTFASFIVFSVLDPGRSDELTGGEDGPKTGVNAIGVTLQLGGITALGAAYMANKLR
ncbi:uncharacterized protein V1516DRAFT_678021 [Lipomyces oligophaga]|uniref:uncharacterized protein n=1 Tax=Lipomyces oligophaga TaxID=45792 RepID=UPI0034CD2C97